MKPVFRCTNIPTTPYLLVARVFTNKKSYIEIGLIFFFRKKEGDLTYFVFDPNYIYFLSEPISLFVMNNLFC